MRGQNVTNHSKRRVTKMGVPVSERCKMSLRWTRGRKHVQIIVSVALEQSGPRLGMLHKKSMRVELEIHIIIFIKLTNKDEIFSDIQNM